MYGWQADEVIGKPIGDIVVEEYPYHTREEVQRQLREEGYWQGEAIHKRRDGTTLNALASATLLRDSAGNVVGAVAITRDITKRVRAEEKLKQTVADLERTNAELERFNRLAVGRELRMIELKRQINQLSEQLGKEPPYDVSFAEEG